jgi:hypothetical protein
LPAGALSLIYERESNARGFSPPAAVQLIALKWDLSPGYAKRSFQLRFIRIGRIHTGSAGRYDFGTLGFARLIPRREGCMQKGIVGYMATAALVTVLAAGANAAAPKSEARHADPAVAPFQPGLEPRAIEILKAASARLAASQSMSFTAIVSYEGPSLLGPPLIYSTKSQVTLRRPNKLKVVTLGDGPPSEFYYDGKVMMAYAPTENLVAIADAPPTIDATLVAAYDGAAIYFPFTDVIVSDPYKDMSGDLKTAFYIGQS